MSGPKSSRYRLTASMLRRILEEEEKRRKILEEKARKEREIKEIKSFLQSTQESCKVFSDTVFEFSNKLNASNETIPNDIAKTIKELYAEISELERICKTQKMDYDPLVKAKAEAEILVEKVRQMINSYSMSINDFVLDSKIANDSKIASGMELSFGEVGKIKEENDKDYLETINRIKELMLLDIPDDLISEVNRALSEYSAIKDRNARENYAAISIEKLVKRCIEFDRFKREKGVLFNEKYDYYISLCRQIDAPESIFDFSEDGLQMLEKAITSMKNQVQSNAEQKYISEAIDDVLNEMGYEVLGNRNVVKKSGKTFKSKLLNYGDGTVVNVTESSDGRITMEIGGMDDSDRLPTSSEREKLKKQMVSFCDDFKVIERKMEERGITLSERLSMAPAEEEYAQIINYTDYQLIDSLRKDNKKRKNESAIKQIRKYKEDE